MMGQCYGCSGSGMEDPTSSGNDEIMTKIGSEGISVGPQEHTTLGVRRNSVTSVGCNTDQCLELLVTEFHGHLLEVSAEDSGHNSDCDGAHEKTWTIVTSAQSDDNIFLQEMENPVNPTRESSSGSSLAPTTTRSSRSDSSGKYSLRDSIGSCNEDIIGQSPHKQQDKISSTLGIPYTKEPEEDVQLGDDDVFTPGKPASPETPTSLTEHSSPTHIGRDSVTSITSVKALLRARLYRSISFKRGKSTNDLNYSTKKNETPQRRLRRTVSLRLPRKHKKSIEDTIIPTIYADEPSKSKGSLKRRASLRRALSLISMNAFNRQQQQQQQQQKQQQQHQQQQQQQHQHQYQHQQKHNSNSNINNNQHNNSSSKNSKC
ncbi:unnamed protein product [Meganyctiphanes norvegica]|uniref:Uncharacterized protein n=1 Tax=Meganyctiphanes norvegica TaxID=48144 RepID=A0AAV2RYG3_MEGNR